MPVAAEPAQDTPPPDASVPHATVAETPRLRAVRPAAELRARLGGASAPPRVVAAMAAVEPPREEAVAAPASVMPTSVAPATYASAAPPDFRRRIHPLALVALGMVIGGTLVALWMK